MPQRKATRQLDQTIKARNQHDFEVWKETLKGMEPGEQLRTFIQVLPVLDGLSNSFWSEYVGRAVVAARVSVGGETPMQCFVCCKPWTSKKGPVEAVVYQFGTGDEPAAFGGVSLICAKCAGNRDGLVESLKRDFKFDNIQIGYPK